MEVSTSRLVMRLDDSTIQLEEEDDVHNFLQAQ